MLTGFIAIGDTHCEGMSTYSDPEIGYVEASWGSLAKIVTRANAYKIPVIGVGDLSIESVSAGNTIEFDNLFTSIQHQLGFIQALGNHDLISGNDIYISTALKNHTTLFDTGYHNTGTLWSNVIIDNKISVIILHNIKDTSSGDYAPVNPAGGEANGDWAGIEKPSSVQRQFLDNALNEALLYNYHVVVVGHRPSYGITPGLGRPIYTTALNSPNGYVKTLENWTQAHNQHILLITGDVHSYSLTKPVVSNTEVTRGGVIHLTLSSGPYFRTLTPQYIKSFHTSYCASGSASQVKYKNSIYGTGTKILYPVIWRTPIIPSGIITSKGLCIFAHITYSDSKMIIGIYIVVPNYTLFNQDSVMVSKNRFTLIDRFVLPIIDNRVSGRMYRSLSPVSRVLPSPNQTVRQE